MNELVIRITDPGANKPLRVTDLIEILGAVKRDHGNLQCSIYSAQLQAHVPLLDVCLLPLRTLTFSAPVGTVVNEMHVDLLNEREDLRQQLAAVPTEAIRDMYAAFAYITACDDRFNEEDWRTVRDWLHTSPLVR